LRKAPATADGGVEQATRVVAQVQHQALEGRALVLFLEILESGHQVLAGMLLELGDAHVAEIGLHQLLLDALDLDDRAGEGDGQGLGLALAHHGEHDVGAGLAAHLLDRVVQGHALHRAVIQLDNEVAALDAGLEGGGVLDGGDHLDEAVLHAHFDAQAAEFALGAHLEFLEGFVVEIGGMGVEAGQHAVDGLGDELLVLDRLDVVTLDLAEDFAEGAQILDGQRLRLPLGVGRIVQGQRGAEDDADADETELFELAGHAASGWCGSPKVQRTQARGSKGLPWWRSSK
jgi:hypothetical protein